jgi:chorismate mutase
MMTPDMSDPVNDDGSTLEEAREEIDAIDRRLVELLAERQEVVDDIAEVKEEAGRDARDPAREEELIDRVRTLAREAGLAPQLAEDIYRDLLDHSVRRQRRRRNGTPLSLVEGGQS